MESDGPPASIAEILAEYAAARAAENDWEAARALLSAAIPAAPTSERLRLDLAHALHQLGDTEAALLECEVAAQLPGAAEAAFHAARLSLLAGRPAETVEGWLGVCLGRDPFFVEELADYAEFDPIRARRSYTRLIEHAWDQLKVAGKSSKVASGGP